MDTIKNFLVKILGVVLVAWIVVELAKLLANAFSFAYVTIR